jgi:hypothetical protein
MLEVRGWILFSDDDRRNNGDGSRYCEIFNNQRLTPDD